MSSRFLVWDFDGTLATRIGGWAGTLSEVIASHYPAAGVPADSIRPYLQRGFPWHTPEVVRLPGSPDDWWDALLPLFTSAVAGAAGLAETDARPLAAQVRSAYLRPESWSAFDDSEFALSQLMKRGWTHIVLSNHVPELASLIETLGLSRLITAVYSSAVTGIEKPNSAAFECVFTDFPLARQGWMIGDSWSADVGGASAVGMRSILVRNRHPEAKCACDTLEDVLALPDLD